MSDWRDVQGSTSRVCDSIAAMMEMPPDEVNAVARDLITRGFLPASRGRSIAALQFDHIFFLFRAVIGRSLGIRKRDCAAFAHRIANLDVYLEQDLNDSDGVISYDYLSSGLRVRLTLPRGAAWKIARIVASESGSERKAA